MKREASVEHVRAERVHPQRNAPYVFTAVGQRRRNQLVPTMPNRPQSIVDYLADREGLFGGARSRFVGILDEDFGYGSRGFRRETWIAGAITAGATAAALAHEIVTDGQLSWTGGTAWLGVGLAAAGLGWLCRKRQAEDREAQWRVYCLLVRPVILVRHPALLDRNRSDATASLGALPKGTLESLGVTAGQSKGELGIAALAGMWVGAIGLRWVQPFGGDWSDLNAWVPIGTAMLAALSWAWWRWWALRSVIRSLPET